MARCIYGDAQEDLGDAMNGGLIAVYCNVGDAVGQAKRGGEIYIYGNVGNRAGIQHRGAIGDGLEVHKIERYLQALRLAGVQTDAKTALGDPHVRRLFSLYHRVEVRELTEEETTVLLPYARRFNNLFNEDVSIEGEVFTVITAAEFQRE